MWLYSQFRNKTLFSICEVEDIAIQVGGHQSTENSQMHLPCKLVNRDLFNPVSQPIIN